MRERASSAVGRRFNSLLFARWLHVLSTHGERPDLGLQRRLLWDDHCDQMWQDGERGFVIVSASIRSFCSHVGYRFRADSATFLPAGLGLVMASILGVVVASAPSAPQRPAAYLHLSVALLVLGWVCIARPLAPSSLGLQVGAAVLLTAIVHLSIGYEANNRAELIFYAGSVLLGAGCLNIMVGTRGVLTGDRRVVTTIDLFAGGLAIYGLVIVLRAVLASSEPFGFVFLAAGFAAALLANFLLRCRAWLKTMA